MLHTSALRRLAAKTQVVEVDAGDFPRTRLTHSLECAQIGRELGGALGCDPDLVDAACLAHDLGHPPFGHNGESALADVAAPCGGFEGNAQSLRLLTRLEAKVPGAGLNLTRATLDATLKYPWLAGPGLAKYGAYADDAEVFAWIRDGAPPGRPCLEAQVMDWADDVAYSVHDLEDGLHAGLTRLSALADRGEQKAISELTAEQYCAPGSVTPEELAEVFDDLLALPCWPAGFDGGPAVPGRAEEPDQRADRAAVRVRPPGDRGRGRGAARSPGTHADLRVPRRQRLECALLKGVTAYYVMSRDGAAQTQARERELIMELAAAVRIGAPGTLDPALRPGYEAAGTDAGRLRVVVDQVATLTDTSAVAWHARLCR